MRRRVDRILPRAVVRHRRIGARPHVVLKRLAVSHETSIVIPALLHIRLKLRIVGRLKLLERSHLIARQAAVPLAADFEPKGEVARAYGAYRQAEGFCERALFVIDKDGVITWSYCSPVGVNPGADGILQALEELEK